MKQPYLYELMTDQANDVGSKVLKALLLCLSFVFQGALGLRGVLYSIGVLQKKKLPKPVISIGNITVGGVGKTPLVIWLAKYLKEQGFKPAILTRGYKSTTQEGNDEVKVLSEELVDVPVIVGANRFDAASIFLQTNTCDVFLLDDGFQHWGLVRDFDIVAVDATNPWGNGFVLPRGILREPLNALKRANGIVITKSDLAPNGVKDINNQLQQIDATVPIVEASHQPTTLIDLRKGDRMDPVQLQKKKLCSFCSIGNPASFELTLKHLGGEVKQSFHFEDHYQYQIEDLKKINKYCLENNIDTVVTTQKDSVKLIDNLNLFDQSLSVYCLKIEISFNTQKDQFLERILHILQR